MLRKPSLSAAPAKKAGSTFFSSIFGKRGATAGVAHVAPLGAEEKSASLDPAKRRAMLVRQVRAVRKTSARRARRALLAGQAALI